MFNQIIKNQITMTHGNMVFCEMSFDYLFVKSLSVTSSILQPRKLATLRYSSKL